MTILRPAGEEIETRPPDATEPRRVPAAGQRAWITTSTVTILTVVPAELAVLSFFGPPTDLAGWYLLSGPLLVGLAVLLARARIDLSMIILTVAVAFPLAVAVEPMDGPRWESLASLSLFVGLCWVTCQLGRQLTLRWSLLWIVGFAAVTIWRISVDVPILILSVGWWLVGVIFRHQHGVAERLEVRVAELAAEQHRFAAEAVRLERARIARELHDVVAHAMTVIVIQARAGQQLAIEDPGSAAEVLDAIATTAAEAEADLDALVEVTNPQPTGPISSGLLDTLVGRAAAVGSAAQVDLHGDLASLPSADAAVIRRALQEAITNVIRYAPAAPIRITLDGRQGVRLTVRNGSPAPHDTRSGLGAGRGLAGLAERVTMLGGSCHWGPTAEGGWCLEVELP